MILVDGHCDTFSKILDEKSDFQDKSLSFNLSDAQKFAPMLQLTAAFVHPKYQNSFQRANNILTCMDQQLEKYQNETIQIKSRKDLDEFQKGQKLAFLYTIENGRAIENNLEKIDYFYSKGVRVITTTWNEDNLLRNRRRNKARYWTYYIWQTIYSENE